MNKLINEKVAPYGKVNIIVNQAKIFKHKEVMGIKKNP